MNSKIEAEAEALDRALEMLPASFAEEEPVKNDAENSRTPHSEDEDERDWGSNFCFI